MRTFSDEEKCHPNLGPPLWKKFKLLDLFIFTKNTTTLYSTKELILDVVANPTASQLPHTNWSTRSDLHPLP